MKYLTETRAWDQIIRDAVQHRTMEHIYYEAGYRAGIHDAERDHKDQQKNGHGNS